MVHTRKEKKKKTVFFLFLAENSYVTWTLARTVYLKIQILISVCVWFCFFAVIPLQSTERRRKLTHGPNLSGLITLQKCYVEFHGK